MLRFLPKALEPLHKILKLSSQAMPVKEAFMPPFHVANRAGLDGTVTLRVLPAICHGICFMQ